MQLDAKTIQDLLQKNSFLFVLSEPLDVANLYLSLAMGLYLNKQGKEVTFLISPGFNDSAKQYLIRALKQYKLQFSEDLKDTHYVIAIDYRDGALDKVSYDTKDGKFLLYISPTTGAEFNFDNVEYQKGGSSFESVVFFGKQLQAVTQLIAGQKKLASITNRLFIDASTGNQLQYGEAWQGIATEQMPVLEFLFQKVLHKDLFTKNISTLFLASTIRLADPLNTVNTPAGLVTMIQELLQREANLPSAFKNTYFYKDWQWLQINQQIFANMQMDPAAKVTWSVVEPTGELLNYVKTQNFMHDAKLPITMVHGVRVGFVIYYVGDGLAYVAIESDGSINLQNFLPGFTYNGTQTKGIVEIRGADSKSIQALVLEKVGTLNKDFQPDLPKQASNDRINTLSTTVHPTEAPSGNPVVHQPNIAVSRDLDDNLIEPPPVVPV